MSRKSSRNVQPQRSVRPQRQYGQQIGDFFTRDDTIESDALENHEIRYIYNGPRGICRIVSTGT